mmetsp:Transcript_127650/g.303309  ORF Transcript_127650/g.303309 Transcript_127650/m.303309 type:complete len:235 (+) Transcript_127650:259-963(+)
MLLRLLPTSDTLRVVGAKVAAHLQHRRGIEAVAQRALNHQLSMMLLTIDAVLILLAPLRSLVLHLVKNERLKGAPASVKTHFPHSRCCAHRRSIASGKGLKELMMVLQGALWNAGLIHAGLGAGKDRLLGLLFHSQSRRRACQIGQEGVRAFLSCLFDGDPGNHCCEVLKLVRHAAVLGQLGQLDNDVLAMCGGLKSFISVLLQPLEIVKKTPGSHCVDRQQDEGRKKKSRHQG